MLIFNHKEIRSIAIKEYMRKAGFEKAVCFSCGNAARELEKQGVDVLHIGKYGDMAPNRWFTQEEISKLFPGYFDATSGHLPMSLMLDIAERYKERLQNVDDINDVPCGSGETLVCLKLAFPDKEFNAIYNMNEATEYSEDAPLNKLVELLALSIKR